MPDTVRKQLYAKEQQDLERKRRHEPSASRLPPIQIINVLPGTSPPVPSCSIQISGPRDIAGERYRDFQCCQTHNEDLKSEFRKAWDLALEHGHDFEQLYEEQNHQFLVNGGVKTGVAK
jgi:hypothetical protein